MSEEHSRKDLAITMNVTRSFTEGSGVTWVSSVYQDEPLVKINEISDKIMAAIARQEIWSRIAMINADIELQAKHRAQVMFNLKAGELQHGDYSSATTNEKETKRQNQEGLIRLDMLIDELKKEQIRLEGKLYD